jgi:hypothetical protein
VAKDYGFKIGFFTTDLPDSRERESEHFNTLPLSHLSQSPGRVTILKPNGSLNWLVPLERPYHQARHGLAFEENHPVVIVPLEEESGRLRYWSSTANFQKAYFPQMNPLPKDVLQCILPPLSEKHTSIDFLKSIREQESLAIKNADLVYILGWSMPQSDSDQTDLITQAVATRTKPFEQIIAINFGAGPDYFLRIQEMFGIGSEGLKICNSGFVDFVNES